MSRRDREIAQAELLRRMREAAQTVPESELLARLAALSEAELLDEVSRLGAESDSADEPPS